MGMWCRVMRPVSYWRLDEAAGPIAADEMAANPGLYQGTPVYGRAGCDVSVPPAVVGSSVGFRVMMWWWWVMLSGLAGDVSFELWLKPAVFGSSAESVGEGVWG